ncbi:MAG TPA: helix-hairpin-helix domain-containing protein [Chthoniobacterales bacterium]|nr:helix-hairpin-helix domain-containing protein [Chthoniobacterales bacterium]
MISRALLIWIALLLPIEKAGASGDWVTLENCRLIPNPANDGDSFHVVADGKEYLFRLYFVDAPETDAANPARLIEQAKHFGISVPQVIEVGEIAREFTRDKLAEPFTVFTRMSNAMGRSKLERFYAFVQTKDGDLGEQLVAKGLARIYGRRVTPPGASSYSAAAQKLQELEDQAKRQKLGGWAANIGGSSAPTASPATIPSRSISVSDTAPPAALPQSTSKNERLFPAKFDINTATEKELRLIPGIGPVMARRIIDARPFRSADDLKKVNGIGDKKYAEIRPYFQ